MSVHKLDRGGIQGIPGQLECLDSHRDDIEQGKVDIVIVVSIMKPDEDNKGGFKVNYSWMPQDDVLHQRPVVYAHLHSIADIILHGAYGDQ